MLSAYVSTAVRSASRRRSQLRRLCGMVGIASLAACSGGGGGALSTLGVAAGAASGSGNGGGSSRTTTATLRIVVPPPTASSSASARRAQYVSPATTSIAGAVTPSAGGAATTFAQNLTPSNPNCVGSASSSLTCTLQLALAPGSYTASFTTYDGALNNSNAPTGNVLSENQSFPVTIVAGQTNTIPVTLFGVPTKLVVLPSANLSNAGSVQSGFSIPNCIGLQTPGLDTFTVIAQDADQNFIVGPGAPTPNLTSPSSAISITQPTSKSPNVFAISGPTVRFGNGALTLSASVTTPATSQATGGITTPISLSASIGLTLTNTCTLVTSGADDGGLNELRAAIQRGSPNFTIVFGSQISSCEATSGSTCTIQLTSPLPPIETNLTIDGANRIVIDGNDSYRAFFVDTGVVTLESLTIQNAAAAGGNGGFGTKYGGGGGGGLGAGAGLFVNQASANVSISGVTFTNLTVTGGNGGPITASSFGGGGGGGFGASAPTTASSGGNGVADSGGGGGGVLAAGGSAPSFGMGGDGGAGGGGGGGDNGEVRSSPGTNGAAYGSNAGSGAASGINGAAGGFGGGGGGSGSYITNGVGGTGGFGGGGGGFDYLNADPAAPPADSGAGGFGGGGGGGYYGAGATSSAGFDAGGGSVTLLTGGTIGGNGGGGAALGPAVFVNLGTLTTVASSATGVLAKPGLGGSVTGTTPGGNGTADQTPVFVNAGGTVNGTAATMPGPVPGAL